MIRLFIAIALSLAAFLGLALRVARDAGNLDVSLPDPVESIRRLDLREQLAALLPDPAPATPETRPEPEAVVERNLANTRSRSFRESPTAEALATETTEVEPDAESPADVRGEVDVARAVPDQDAWADLLRRMFAVYERVGAGR